MQHDRLPPLTALLCSLMDPDKRSKLHNAGPHAIAKKYGCNPEHVEGMLRLDKARG